MNDINVPKEIDFKGNQERIRELNKQKKKEKKLRNIIYGLICTIIIISMLFILSAMKKDAYKSCVANGMSTEWCEAHTD